MKSCILFWVAVCPDRYILSVPFSNLVCSLLSQGLQSQNLEGPMGYLVDNIPIHILVQDVQVKTKLISPLSLAGARLR